MTATEPHPETALAPLGDHVSHIETKAIGEESLAP